MSTSEQLDLFEFEEEEGGSAPSPPKKRRRYGPANYRRFTGVVPVPNGTPFVIVPEVAPLVRELCDLCAVECPGDQNVTHGHPGVGVLAARAALILKQSPASVQRRLYAVVHQKQLFIRSTFIEGLLMAMDVEHEYRDRYGEWPSCRADALEKVSLEAEYAGKQLSPTKLLGKANRLYEKGIRKALKHVPEVDS